MSKMRHYDEIKTERRIHWGLGVRECAADLVLSHGMGWMDEPIDLMAPATFNCQ